MNQIKKRVFEILEVAATGDTVSRIFDIFIMTLIAVNVVAVILETEEVFSHYMVHIFKLLKYSL